MDPLRQAAPVDLRPALLTTAFLLFIADALASLWLAGSLTRRLGRAAAALTLVGLAIGFSPHAVRADPKPGDPTLSQSDLQSVLNTRLAYVASGDTEVDGESKAGLATLSQVLAQRTALIPADPVGVDPDRG